MSEITVGRGLFHNALSGAHRIGDIRHELEKKLVACLATGGTNGNPVQPYRIANRHFRSLALEGMSKHSWTVADLLAVTGNNEGAAGLALIATMEEPIWGHYDVKLLDGIEMVEEIQEMALAGGRTL